jgi:hypothetical protein
MSDDELWARAGDVAVVVICCLALLAVSVPGWL